MVQHTTQVRNIQLKYYNAFNENQNLAFHNLIEKIKPVCCFVFTKIK